MHDIKFFEANTEAVKENLKKRNFDTSLVDKALELNAKRKELTKLVEDNRAEIKNISKEIGMLKKEGKDASEVMSTVANIKASIEGENVELEGIVKKLDYTLSIIPNLLSSEVPTGTSEEDNTLCKEWGTPKEFSFQPKDHVALGENLDMLDFERGAKITGARFVVYKKSLARLERALINYMLDEHAKFGYEEIIPPFIVNAQSLYGTGQLPKFEEDLFKLNHEDKDWYLIPTAEVPLTNLKRDELFSGDELPIKYCAYSPCFRSEAGSYGKDTRGLIRLHQFNKVELVEIVAPEDSEKAHEEMIHRACSILEALKLPYKSILLCSGDIGFGASICFDLEVWLPGQQKYREISSLSNCRDFQARRASIRFRDKDGKPQFAHTLNGSGLAVGRTVVAIMENYQREDGTIEIPEVLRSYMGGQESIG
ncbi:MAG: serine--tRNA ligase [Deltaproteobacteria bacterium]|nr:MAG: serine--tRNA ligase [Deltaproteobacteria bacterium]